MGASYADIYLDRYKQLEEACREAFDLGTSVAPRTRRPAPELSELAR